MEVRKASTWSNMKVVLASCISLLGAVALLTIFIVFLSLSKPAYRDLHKFIFATLIVNFVLFVVYGIVGFMKDESAVQYGIKTWTCCIVVCTTVATLTMISLHKSTERRLPTSCLWTSVGVAGAIFLLNTLFCITDMNESLVVMDKEPQYMLMGEKDDKTELERTGTEKFPKATTGREDSKVDSQADSRVITKPPPKAVESFTPERSLRKEINPPRNSIIKNYKKDAEGIKVKWDRTHFILGIEGGRNMKKRWGQVISGLQVWVKKLGTGSIRISLFTFDSTFHLGPICKTPSEFAEALAKGIEIRGGNEIDMGPAISTFSDIIKSPEIAKNNALNFLHYGAILTGEETNYPESELAKFAEFKKREGVNFFFNLVTMVRNPENLRKLALNMEGVHYSIRENSDFGLAFGEALERDPLKAA